MCHRSRPWTQDKIVAGVGCTLVGLTMILHAYTTYYTCTVVSVDNRSCYEREAKTILEQYFTALLGGANVTAFFN